MNFLEAYNKAQELLEQLSPHCDRIEIAGSIRRRCREVKDIEIVCIPKPYQTGLFEDGIASVVNQWPAELGQLPCKYTRRMLPEGIKLDLFFATPENWGYIFLIRTGPADFSKAFVGALMPSLGYRCQEGFVRVDGRPLKTPEEADVFGLANLPFIRPEYRQHYDFTPILRRSRKSNYR